MLEVDQARVRADGAPRHPSRFVRRLRGSGTVARRHWRRHYVRSIVLTDAVCGLFAGLAAFLLRFDQLPDPVERATNGSVAVVALVLPVVWVAAMFATRSYEERFLWVGGEEFRRVLTGAVWTLAAVGTTSWALRWDLARGFVIWALPLATFLTLITRYARRQVLHRRRRTGLFRQTTLVVGHRRGVQALVESIERSSHHGLDVVGCCVPGPGRDEATVGSVDVLGSLTDVLDVVQAYDIDTVAVLPSPELDGAAMRQLGWGLEKTQAELLLAPSVTEVAGPRVAIRPVAGLPLLHVERPELTGVRRLAKTAFDVTVAAIGLFVLLPLWVVIAAAVGLTSRGGVFYRQRRIGLDGEPFDMLKFRSMVAGADAALPSLRERSQGNEVLFKMRDDPRVTPVGKVLRRFSLDEVPQLWNVLTGHMSLVGPRPPLPHETDKYGFDMHRRFLVKPGMTGLWQISGRSDLSWEDSVRMDVRYVENWSFGMDLFILWKTIGAVRGGAGAY